MTDRTAFDASLEKTRAVNSAEAAGEVAYALAALAQSGQGEAVYQYQEAGGSWIDQDKSSYDYNVKRGSATVRVLYTRPQPAQPPENSNEDFLDDVYKQCCALIKPLVDAGKLPGSLVESLQILVSREAQPARVVGTVTGYQTASGAQQWQFNPSNVAGLENQRFDVALSTPTAAPTPSQQADLRAALWHIKNTAISLADAQVTALEALAAYAKKAGA